MEDLILEGIVQGLRGLPEMALNMADTAHDVIKDMVPRQIPLVTGDVMTLEVEKTVEHDGRSVYCVILVNGALPGERPYKLARLTYSVNGVTMEASTSVVDPRDFQKFPGISLRVEEFMHSVAQSIVQIENNLLLENRNAGQQ